MNALSFVFSNPLLLAALVALPAIWWLLRLTPPKPVMEVFPPLRILASVIKREETPSKSPWWLTLLRMLMAAAVILASADPVFNPRENTVSTDGPLVLVIDNSWATARDWPRRVETAQALIDDAEKRDLPVSLVLTALQDNNAVAGSAADARNRLAAARPEPLRPDRTKAIAALRTALSGTRPGTLVYLSDGVEEGNQPIVAALTKLEPEQFRLIEGNNRDVVAFSAAANDARALRVTASRIETTSARKWPITAYDTRGRAISYGTLAFAAGKRRRQGRLPRRSSCATILLVSVSMAC